MEKIRVFELAKELNVSSKDLLIVLRRWDIEAKNHMSNLEPEQADLVRRRYLGEKAPETLKEKTGPAMAKQKTGQEEQKKAAQNKASAGKAPAKPAINQGLPQKSPVNNNIPRPAANLNRTQDNKAPVRNISPSTKRQPNQQISSVTPKRPVHAQKPYKTPPQPVKPAQQQSTKNIQKHSKLNQQPKGVQQPKTIQQPKSGPQHSGSLHHSRIQAPVQAEKKGPAQTKKAGTLLLPESIQVKEFANLMGLTASDVIKKLMSMGTMVTINQEIDFDTAAIVAHELGWEVEALPTEAQQLLVQEIEDKPEDLEYRPPVVTIMGHVDHGKTSLLDAIRSTNVMAQESGGITQHIGAYQVEFNNKSITFLDTPGHEAFTAMRARGAQVTDIAILVVAADDGVMPQTVEAINHAKAANIPIIVAINKIDKPGANPDKVKQQLTEHNLVAEEWGGDTIMVPVSAKQKTGLDDLLETILLVAEIKEYKANPNRQAKGAIIEAKLDKGLGPVATVLVQNGTLNMGDTIIAGTSFGRVRAMINDKGKRIKKAGPSTPVEVLGFNEPPQAGDMLYVVEERVARDLAAKRQNKRWEEELKKTKRVTLNDLYDKIKEGTIKEVKLIVKADVQGSVEAITQALDRLTNKQVRVNVIHSGVGAITESDVMLASAFDAIIIGFNVRPDPLAKKVNDKENVDIRLYRVIYEIIEDIEAAMTGLLEPEIKENILGHAEVRAVFKIPKVGAVAGCFVLDGKILRSSEIRVLRDNIVIHEGKIGSLKRFKDDVKDVASGYECGIGLEKFNDIKEGDVIEAFIIQKTNTANN